MKKKLFSIFVALVLYAAFFIPAYAQDFPPREEAEEITITLDGERVPPNLVIIPPTVEELLNQMPEESAPSNGAGLINTPSGAGTLLEDVCQSEVNRQFITVQSRGGNVFYIIIDNDRNGQNVYFLNAVDDFDLLTFSDDFPDGVIEAYEELKEEVLNAQNSENAGGEETNTIVKPNNPDNSEDEFVSGNNTQIYIVTGIGALFLGGLVYFKFIKGKKKAVKTPTYDSDEEEDDEESEEQEED